jgi:glycosyltransferase involved in cell wall biosynthesis
MIKSKRQKVGLVFYDYEHWTGGTYYILNLVNALGMLPDDQKVELIAFTKNDADFQTLKNTNYPYLIRSTEIKKLDRLHFNIVERLINKITRVLIKKNLINKQLDRSVLDAIFPVQNESCALPGRDFYFGSFFDRIPKIYWIPDFQEHYLPQFFSEKEIKSRSYFQKTISERNEQIVFSSKDAQGDFKEFYPGFKADTHVLNFAVSHPPYTDLDIETLKQEFDLQLPYFFSPNQFWIHKNHMIVLKAIKILKKEGKNFLVCFSGKESDSRGHNYFETLKEFVREHGLEKHVKFLGFIDRKKQLKLMSKAIAIIQPSLFEGWSTVIEDTKAMNQYVLVSNLKVHEEQLKNNCVFFNRFDEKELSEKMKIVLEQPISKTTSDYSNNVRKFAEDFIEIIKKCSNESP